MMEGSIPSSSGLSTPTPTPTSSSSPAAASVFKPRRSEDWNKYKATIESLYRDDQLKLRDVKRIMEREHKFVASEKQYKDRLAAWNIRKNIKAKEVNIMIRKQQKRAARGKQTVFRVAGQKVDTKRIARFVRRYGTNSTWDGNEPRPVEPQHDSPEPTTPSDMSYYTPEPDERPTTLSPHPENHPHPCETPASTLLSYSRCTFLVHGIRARILVNQENHLVDSLDSVHDSELDDTKSLPVTLSPTTSTNDTPTPAETYTIFCDDPWRSLTMYQDQIQKLTAQLDRETAGFVSADDSRQQ